ncbi:MAG: hypothetical protein II085_03485 [Alphaproteobacteria bacterium]|nr:hypothetical protein [Alphaproteobacteria bacterium]
MAHDKDGKNIDDGIRDIILIDKIYQSFEALEDTLGKLKLEEPLFMTYMAKKSFADKVFNQIKHYHEKVQAKKYIN